MAGIFPFPRSCNDEGARMADPLQHPPPTEFCVRSHPEARERLHLRQVPTVKTPTTSHFQIPTLEDSECPSLKMPLSAPNVGPLRPEERLGPRR